MPAETLKPNPVLDRFDVSGKVAIVTGASKGIGRAIAEALAWCGASVVLSSRTQADLDAAAADLNGQGLTASAIAADAGKPADLRRLADRAHELFGGVDILVNNAGMIGTVGTLADAPDDEFDRIVRVNLRGPLELSKAVRPMMKARGGGSIIHVASVAALRPAVALGLYSMTKAGLLSLTRTMAREWGPEGIRCNALCPGLIQTELSASLWQNEESRGRILRQVPLGRIGQPDDMTELAVYLASPASGYCSGAAFTADGGLLS